MRIIEICDDIAYGDGVGNDILSKADLFIRMGYECDIYGIRVDSRLKPRVKLLKNLSVKKDDIIIHHYPGYSESAEAIKDLNCIKVMMYHNMTPPELVDGITKKFCEKGMQQLPTMKGRYNFYAAVSDFDLNCLIEMEITQEGDVLHNIVEFTNKNHQENIKQEKSETIFMFIGRLVQSKRTEDVIKIFDYYFNYIDSNSRLLLPGFPEASPDYTQYLYCLKDSLNSKEHIEFLGHISNEELHKVFQKADIYISMSEHEGVGLPLLEAMSYNIPVLAYDAAAVKGTLGNSGILVGTREPLINAYLIDTVLRNKQIKNKIINAQLKNLTLYSREAVEGKAKRLLCKWSKK